MRNIEKKTKKKGFSWPHPSWPCLILLIFASLLLPSPSNNPCHPRHLFLRYFSFRILSLLLQFCTLRGTKKRGYCVCSPPPYFFTWRVDRGLDNIISSRFLFFSLSNAKSSLHRSSPESYDTELTLKLRGEPERCLRTTF